MRDAAMSLVLLVAFTDLTVSSYTSCRHVQHRPSTPAAVMMVEQRRGGDGENSDDDELISYEDWDLAWKRHALGSIIEAYDVIEENSDADETSCRDSAEAGRTAAIREFLQTLQICSFVTLLVWSYTIAARAVDGELIFLSVGDNRVPPVVVCVMSAETHVENDATVNFIRKL